MKNKLATPIPPIPFDYDYWICNVRIMNQEVKMLLHLMYIIRLWPVPYVKPILFIKTNRNAHMITIPEAFIITDSVIEDEWYVSAKSVRNFFWAWPGWQFLSLTEDHSNLILHIRCKISKFTLNFYRKVKTYGGGKLLKEEGVHKFCNFKDFSGITYLEVQEITRNYTTLLESSVYKKLICGSHKWCSQGDMRVTSLPWSYLL